MFDEIGVDYVGQVLTWYFCDLMIGGGERCGICCRMVDNGEVLDHHRFVGFCKTREKYRQGRRDTAVKVYTISSESQYLLVHNVPGATDLSEELRSVFQAHGTVTEFQILRDYPRERFTDVYRIKFEKLADARLAKRKVDNVDFYGGQLHLCYAPEYETVMETRKKLSSRRRWVASVLEKIKAEMDQKDKDTETKGSANSDSMKVGDGDYGSSKLQAISMKTVTSGAMNAVEFARQRSSKVNWHRITSGNIRKRRSQAEKPQDLVVSSPKRRAQIDIRRTEFEIGEAAKSGEVKVHGESEFGDVTMNSQKVGEVTMEHQKLDIRQVEVKRQSLRMIPRSVSIKGNVIKRSTIQ